jgi:SAM-dependent methyltransferase
VNQPTRRALFCNPPLHLPADFVDYPWFAHHGLLFAAARVARAGWDVRLVDAFAQPASGRVAEGAGWRLGAGEDDLVAALPDGDFDVVVIGASPFLRPWDPHPATRAWIAAVRARYPGASLVLADCDVGGMHVVDYDGAAVLNGLPALDAVLRYAGEASFDAPERLAALRGSRSVVNEPPGPWEAPPPFPMLGALDPHHYGRFLSRCFLDRPESASAPARVSCGNPSPEPARSGGDDGLWSNPFAIDADTRPFLTSSGCPHRCVFCSSNAGWRASGRKIQRTVPLAVVQDWAQQARRDHGARRLFVLDEMANLRDDFEDVLNVFERLDLRYEFPNGLRADRLGPGAIARMKDRVSLLSVSAESASAADLAGPIGKRQSPAQVARVVAEAARVGLPTLVHFIIGFPWETTDAVQATLDFAVHLHETYGATPAVQFATPLRGTPLFDACLAAGLVTPDSGTSADGSLFQHRPAFRPPAIPEGFLQSAHAAFQRRIEGGPAAPQAPAAEPERPGSNSFDYIPVRALPEFVLDPSHCTAQGLGLATARTSRAAIVAVDARFILCRTDTSDFGDAEIRSIVHGRGQLYLDVSGKAAIDDFGRDVRQVVLSHPCRGCPDLPTCCGCHVPAPTSFFHEDEARIHDWLAERTGRVLDVGMGWVPYLSSLADRIRSGRIEYHGLDPDPAVIAAAGASDLPLRLHLGEIEAFTGDGGPFDAVVALRSLNHFRDVGRALDVMAGCLRTGGQALLVESLPLPLVRARRHAVRAHRESAGRYEHLRNWDSSQVVDLLRGRPFEVLEERPVGRDTCDQWILRLRRA